MVKETMASSSRVSRLYPVVVVLLITTVVVLYGGWSKPIWIDEYNLFAMGSLTFPEMISVLWESTGSGLNWGQTGAYYVADWFLLNIFGANEWALRAPSILSAAILLAAAVSFMRLNAANRVWQLRTILAFAGQSTLFYYVSAITE